MIVPQLELRSDAEGRYQRLRPLLRYVSATSAAAAFMTWAIVP